MGRVCGRRILSLTAAALLAAGCAGEPEEPASGEPPAIGAEVAPAAAHARRRLRPVAPLSGSLAGAPRPRFRVTGAPPAVVQICADRACNHPLQELVAVEGSGRPLRPLRAGVVFWRARALDGRGSWTAPWELFVPPGGRAPDATRGLRLDANADGFADAVVRDQNGEAATDRLHVYLGGPGGLNPASDTVLPLDTSHFGVPAASAGDVNGDGFGDVAVSDGRGVVVYAGSAAGLAAAPLSVSPALAGIQPFDFGWQLLAGGDVNGDGYGDVFVSDGGRHVWLYLGSPAGLPATPVWTLDASATGSSAALLTAADLNGDGFGDVVVKYGGTETGFRVFRGGAAGLEPSGAGTFVARPQLPSGTAGDLNGDGIPDLVTTEFTQLAFFPGGHAFPPAGPTQVLPTANPVAPLQIADFDGDGRADLAAITSTPTDNIYFTDDRVDVHRGTPGGFATPPHTTILETAVLPDNTLNFGERISAADFDGDGRDDLLVGAPAPFPTPFFATTNPAVFVFAGSSAGLQPAPAPRITGVPGYASWVSAAAPGDVL